MFGFTQIRIFIGTGKPLFHFKSLGFTWLIQAIPFGGLTFAKPPSSGLIRWQWMIFAAAGLITNACLAAISWWVIRHEASGFVPQATVLAFFWANMLIIAENLFPYTVATPFGPLDTDGKLLYRAVCRWNQSLSDPKPINSWAIRLARLLKAMVIFFLLCCALLLFLFAGIFAFAPGLKVSLGPRIILTLFFAALGAILAWYAWRVFSHKPPITTPGLGRMLEFGWLDELHTRHTSSMPKQDLTFIENKIRASQPAEALAACERHLEKDPHDLIVQTYRAIALTNTGNAGAHAAWSSLAALIDPKHVALHAWISVQHLRSLFMETDRQSFVSACRKFLELPIPDAQKISCLDQLACIPLHVEAPHTLPNAEFCARTALEFSAQLWNVKGTLGCILVELGQDIEAQPLLQACYDSSPAFQDQGVSALYLGILAHRAGALKQAETLARRAIALHPEPWLIRKAETLIQLLQAAKTHA